MRRTSLGITLALLIVGCGFDSGPTAPEAGPTPGEPGVLPVEPVIAAAVTNSWAKKAPMPTARSVFAAGVVNGVLYAVAGETKTGTKLATVEAYTPGSNSWATKAPLPSARGRPNGTGTINGVLYVAGGRNSSGLETTTLFAYTASTNTWTTKAPVLKPGGCGASGVIGGKLYVYSGVCGKAGLSFQRYDPATNSWTLLTTPGTDHTFPAAGVIAGNLYLAGGGSGSTAVDSYDPATNAWTPRPRCRLGASARRER